MVDRKCNPKVFAVFNEYDKFIRKHRQAIKNRKHLVSPFIANTFEEFSGIINQLEDKITYKSNDRGMVSTLFANVSSIS